jgi:outer membrane protein assembly factor BamB
MTRINRRNFLITFVLIYFLLNFVLAGDWPTYQNDIQRSAISRDNLKPNLFLSWTYHAASGPQPAWADPAKTDYWHREANLKPRVIYDKAYHVIGSNGRVYFGSSADNKIYCLDAGTGSEIWSYFTGGPVRLAPAFANGLIYTGSDDGVVYCLDAVKGSLIW